jgi:hypothetical protein
LRSYPSADDGLPHPSDRETAAVHYWERCTDGASQAGPDMPAIPRTVGNSLQIPNIGALLLFLLKPRGFQGIRACGPLGDND